MKKAIAIKLNDQHAKLTDGSCPSHHSPNDVISFGTPNKIRSTNHITLIIQNRHRTLSVRTLRVRELSRHDRDTCPVNNQQRNLDAHIGSHIFYEDLYQSNCYDNIRYSLCHRYVTCPRFDRRYLHT